MHEDLTTFIEPELEARLVALVLGEASAFEQEELKRIIAERPEVRLYHSRLTILHGLVDEATNPVDAISWKLSGERRGKVLARIREQRTGDAPAPARKPAYHFRRRLIFYGSAACFIAILGGLATPVILKDQKVSSPVSSITTYSAADDQVGLEEVVSAPRAMTRERASAGDLLATNDGNYSQEVPTVKTNSRFYADRLATSLSGNPESEKSAKEEKPSSLVSGQKSHSPDREGNTANVHFDRESTTFREEDFRNRAGKDGVQASSAPSKGAVETKPSPEPAAIAAPGQFKQEKGGEVAGSAGREADSRWFSNLSDTPGGPVGEHTKTKPADVDSPVDSLIVSESLDRADVALEREPEEPSSAMSKVIATNNSRPAAAPVPGMDAEFTNGKADGRRTAGSNSFLGGGIVGSDSGRNNADFSDFEVPRKIPGIPESPGQKGAGIASGGNRRGAEALRENTMDALLNEDWGTTAEGIAMNDDAKSTEFFGRGEGGSAGGSDPFFAPPVHQSGKLDEERRFRQLETTGSGKLTSEGEISKAPARGRDEGLKAGAPRAQLKRTASEVDSKSIVQEAGFEKTEESERLVSKLKTELSEDSRAGKALNLGLEREKLEAKLSLVERNEMEKNDDEDREFVESGYSGALAAAKEAPVVELQDEKQALISGIDADLPLDESALVQRQFAVPDSFELFLSSSAGGVDDDADPFGGAGVTDDGMKARAGIVEILKNNGVSFPPGATAVLQPETNTLVVRSSPESLAFIDGIVKASGVETLREEERKKKQVELETFETSTSTKTDSTFSLNVSDVSFKLAKSSLANGQWPEADKVRPEEFVNALSYGDDTPTQAEKVACVIEQGSHPFMQQRNLMRVSMSTAALGRNASTPLRLTVLLDQSGSMERADRAESVRRAFALLSSQLNANDEITLVGFARTSRLLAERVKGDQSGRLAEIVSNPLTEGGTNLEAALSSGLQLARQQFVEGAQNRIILLTDGAANLGDALPENLARQVTQMRDAGIAFDACGVGADGFNDEVLTSLAKQGDGRYYFLDRPEDADEGFARQIAGALRPAAKNVKVQVIFNPERVSKFKLYGFEKHQLKKEDFRNDAVDAAEMAAEESGVALYHFQPLPEGRGDIGTVSVRFLDTATDQMVERTWTIPYQSESGSFSVANPTLRLAGVAGLFAERLKGSPVGERVELKRLRQESELLKPVFGNQPRFQELQTMLQQAGD